MTTTAILRALRETLIGDDWHHPLMSIPALDDAIARLGDVTPCPMCGAPCLAVEHAVVGSQVVTTYRPCGCQERGDVE